MDPSKRPLQPIRSTRVFSRSGKVILLVVAYGIITVGTIRWGDQILRDYEKYNKECNGGKANETIRKIRESIEKAKHGFLGITPKKSGANKD